MVGLQYSTSLSNVGHQSSTAMSEEGHQSSIFLIEIGHLFNTSLEVGHLCATSQPSLKKSGDTWYRRSWVDQY